MIIMGVATVMATIIITFPQDWLPTFLIALVLELNFDIHLTACTETMNYKVYRGHKKTWFGLKKEVKWKQKGCKGTTLCT